MEKCNDILCWRWCWYLWNDVLYFVNGRFYSLRIFEFRVFLGSYLGESFRFDFIWYYVVGRWWFDYFRVFKEKILNGNDISNYDNC